MGPVGHAEISSALGAAIWFATDSVEAAGVAVGVGVLMDVDHLYDCYQRYIRGNLNKTYLLFHGWEYSVTGLAALLLVYYHPIFLACVLAHFWHVATDQCANGLRPLGYSITYRAVKRFDAASISPNHDPVTGHRIMLHHIPFGFVLEPWFQRRVEMILSSKSSPRQRSD